MDTQNISRRERKKQETKSNILRTARHLFRDNGIDNTSIEDITEKVDISRGTFFNYFSNKDGLIIGIVEDEVDELIDYLEDELIGIASAVTKLKLFYKKIIEDAIQYLHITEHVIISTILKSDENSFCIFKEYYAITEKLVIEAQKNKEITDKVAVDQIVSLILGCYYSVLHECFYTKEVSNAVMKLDNMIDLLFNGIEGEKYIMA